MSNNLEILFMLMFSINYVNFVQCNQNKLNFTNYASCTSCNVKLIINEDELMRNLQRYKVKLREKLEIIRFYTSYLQKEHRKSEDNAEGYLSNPLNALKLIRRMHLDWIQWQEFMKKPTSNEERDDIIPTLLYNMPTNTDLKEAIAGIVRIQNTYNIKTNLLSRGIFKDQNHENRFSTLDCYAIGNYLFNETKYVPALNWFNASLDLYTEYDAAMSNFFGVDRIEILNSIAMSHYKMGDKNGAANAFKKALEYGHDDEIALRNLDDMQELIEHDKLCRGEVPQRSNLFCRYNSTTTPFLKIAPLKMEEISIDPFIVLYYDIIYDSEIKELKETSLPGFQRSEVGDGMKDPSRTNQNVNQYSTKSVIVERINRRIVDMSGLMLSDEDVLQVMNYGIGGHYENHLDYYEIPLPERFKNIGNRLATMLIYLNDVEKGGGTAFSAIKKVIQPKKGTAVLWHHLDNKGNGIMRTVHASCPVLVGSKWMALRFIYYLPQLFEKPCYN